MKPHIYISLFLYCVLSTTIVLAQEHSISGFIDDDQGQSIAFAHVILMNVQDSSIVKGVSSNNKGFFLLDKLAPDTYLLKFSFMGHTDVYKSVLVNNSIELEAIVLKESSEQLDEINIIAKRPTLTKLPDRLVFNIESTALIEGDMFKVLKNTPGVLVINNNIQVKNATPTVYINDRQVHLNGEELVQLLESSSANSIKSVEVITNPSAKYDAESGAVINIVMSKNLVTGYRGNVFANYTQGVFPKYDVGMSHFFKNDKINFFANYTYSDNKINRDDQTTINYLDNTQAIDQIWESNANRNTWAETHNFNFDFDYSFDDRNSLSLSSAILWLPYYKYKISNRTNVFGANQDLDFYYNSNNHSNDNKYNLGFDLDYVHKFEKAGEKLTFNTHFTTYDYQRDQNVMSTYYKTDNSFLQATAYRTDNDQHTKIFTAQTNYTLPLTDTSSLETGLKFSNIDTNSAIVQFNIDNAVETPDNLNSDAFDYNEEILAAYVNYSIDWEKLSLITGVRAEQTNVEGFSISNNESSKLNYLELFPTASINYTISDNVSLFTNYKRSISRPDYASLNPFRFFLDDNTIVTGNPNLQPVIVNSVKIGTSLFNKYTFEAYYKTDSDNIFELPIQDNVNKKLIYTPVNISKTTEFGFDFTTYFNIGKNWSVTLETSLYNTKDEDDFNSVLLSRDQWANYTMLSNNFTFLKDESLTANVMLIYASKGQQGFIEVNDLFLSELSIAKAIFKNKGTISLAISDLFNTHDFKTRSRYLNQYNSSVISQDTRTIKLGFRYKFGNTTLEANQRSKSQEEIERLANFGN